MGATQSCQVPQATNQYARALPNTASATRGEVHMSDIPSDFQPHMTLYTNLMDRKRVDPGNRPIFGWRKVDSKTKEVGAFEWVTFSQFLTEVDAVASGMNQKLGLTRGDMVGVFSKNRYEWVLVEHATNRMAYVLVPLYDTLGPNAIPFIMNQTEMKVVFCAKGQFKTLMSCIHNCPSVKTVVQFEDDIDDEEHTLAKEHSVKLVTLSEVLAVGKANPVAADPPKPDDICTICYTSGTTGNPKGAMLTHANVVSAAHSIMHYANLVETDVHLSYLPLAHVFERVVQVIVVTVGGSIGFYQGEVSKIMEDLAELKPTIFPSVPRLLNRVFDKITQGVSSAGGIKKFLFDQAFAAKKAHLSDGRVGHGVWDPIVFNKVRMALGGRVRIMMNGSAPISHEVKEFLQIVFSCPVLEGYGMTESSAVISCTTVNIPPGKHVGIPLGGLQVRLEDVPEMSYTSKDQPRPRGEILVKGPNVFAGYYKQPEQTAEVLDSEGWLRTGDIGCWNEDGTLSIIDRKKNIFKLQQGEYVAPEKIENIYIKSQYVAQVFVHGDSMQSYLVGIVVPDADVVAKWAADNGITGEDATLAKLCAPGNDSELKKVIMKDLEEVGKAYKLFRFERIQKLHLHSEQFTPENELVTPTFKLKRAVLAQYFAKEIEEMYSGEPAP